MAGAMLPSLVAGMLVASVSRLKMSDTTKFANDAVTAPIEAAAAAPEAIASERHPPQWLAALARPLVAIPALLAFSALIFA